VAIEISRKAGIAVPPVPLKKAAKAALSMLGKKDAELSILITDNEGIRELNKKYRSMDKPTDVLSFPMDGDMLGDVVISVEKAATQAPLYKNTVRNEILRLLIHGILHLLGYEHVNGGLQSRRMKDMEKKLFKKLKHI